MHALRNLDTALHLFNVLFDQLVHLILQEAHNLPSGVYGEDSWSVKFSHVLHSIISPWQCSR